MPSRNEADQYYTVDMSIGVCESPVGFNGSPCTHQHIIWAKTLADSVNFVPIFNNEERQRWARIAFDTALPLTYCEGLHSPLRTQTDAVDFVEQFIESPQKVSYIKLSVMTFGVLDVQLMLSQIDNSVNGACLENQ